MSCFIVCDGNDCWNNEGDSSMFSVPNKLTELLKGYSDASSGADDLCMECIKSVAKDDFLNTRIGLDEYDELCLADSSDCVTTLKDKYAQNSKNIIHRGK